MYEWKEIFEFVLITFAVVFASTFGFVLAAAVVARMFGII